MKYVDKICYDIPEFIKKTYWHIRKEFGQYIMFRFIFPIYYRNKVSKKQIKINKAVFVEVRFSEITDNFKLVHERLEAKGFEVHDQFIENIKPGKAAYIKRCLRMLNDIADAEFVFLNDACNVTSCIDLRKETQIFQLWHACGAFKKWGMSTAEKIFGESRQNLEKYPNYKNLKYVTVSSPEVIWAYEEAMNLKHEDGQVIPIGVSRTDVFFERKFQTKAVENVCGVFPNATDKKVILYAPTFRGRVASAEGPDRLEIGKMKKSLGAEYVLLVKHHPFVRKRPPIPEDCKDFAMDVTELLDIDQLLCASDVCISDYSSLIFEYSLFERPMLFFAYDEEEYFDWRGFYYNYEELTPGPIVKSTDEIVAYIKSVDTQFDKEQVCSFKKRFMSSCDGHATDRIVELVLEKNKNPHLIKGE